jgi:molybdopterin-containing oxidoreductase family iron-sulfur binding subunit
MLKGPQKRLHVLHDAELPRGAEEPEGGVGRRRFLELVGVSIALAGAGACTRQPPEEIVPYVRQPEEIVPGRPLFYATSMVYEGYATGLLVESHMGRPVKVEGSPDHPASLGATDAPAQASVLTLYDPDRSQVITRLGRISTWDRLTTELGQVLAAERAGGGAGVRILTETITSPSLTDQIQTFLKAYPAARWHRYQACGDDSAAEGARIAFGSPLCARYDLKGADVVLALDSDLLASGPGNLRYAHDFMARRRAAAGRGMNRLYAIESSPTCTGTLADHRLALRAGEIGAFAMAVAAEIGVPGAVRPSAPMSAEALKWASAIAADLRAAGQRSLVVAGEHASPAVHVVAHSINAALGATGSTVVYSDPVNTHPDDSVASLRTLVDEMAAGRVTTLIIIGGNPVFTAPADLDVTGAMAKVPLRVHLSLYEDETSAYCHWHIPEAHFLEAWGDARAFDGTVSLIQPLIQPLYGGKSAPELMAAINGAPNASGLDLLKGYWRGKLGAGPFEGVFRKAIHDGFIPATSQPAAAATTIRPDAMSRAAEVITAMALALGEIELIFRPDPAIGDGQFANNGWLQELPKPHTKLTWDNAALIGPAMAARLGLHTEDVVELTHEGRTVRAPIYVLPGHPDGAVTVHLGYGRTRSGRIGTGAGFNAYALRTESARWHARGLAIKATGERRPLASTQSHFLLEGRAHVRSTTDTALREHPRIIQEMGEAPPPEMTLYPQWSYPGYAWGMAVDLGACTGCSACVVACNAENNVPVVGKDQVLAGREMHWLRIDRYYEGDLDAPEAHNQPMMCVHCENAPCEVPCPVAATTHSAEGLNEMTYNRCVGTRYCSNNCPYKVRRFNYFDYQAETTKSLRLLHNPDVTVRSRGVMEKCTYCVQRISAARISASREGRVIKDGEIVTACQQACPTGAIVFGDINDPGSRVRRLRDEPRSYGVLAELNTRPRTAYLAKIKNPNPALGGG